MGVNPSVTNRDHDVFGPDSDDFNPDRWLPRDGEAGTDFEARLRAMRDVADHVFGGGTRVCMGRYLAQLELWKLFATLYSVFDVSCAPRCPVCVYGLGWTRECLAYCVSDQARRPEPYVEVS